VFLGGLWTNEYHNLTATPRQRRDRHVAELQVWLAIVLDMGLVRVASTLKFWGRDHFVIASSKHMSQHRWHPIKRFIKFQAPDNTSVPEAVCVHDDEEGVNLFDADAFDDDSADADDESGTEDDGESSSSVGIVGVVSPCPARACRRRLQCG